MIDPHSPKISELDYQVARVKNKISAKEVEYELESSHSTCYETPSKEIKVRQLISDGRNVKLSV